MKKLVYGVGVNDLGYRVHVQEWVTKAWRKRKHELAQLVANTESDMRVVEALKKRYSFEEWYKLT